MEGCYTGQVGHTENLNQGNKNFNEEEGTAECPGFGDL